MISDLPLPEYYVRSFDVDVNPTVGETIIGAVGIEFELENPEYIQEPPGFQCDAHLEMELYIDGNAPWQSDEEDVELFGSAVTDFLIYLPENGANINEYVQAWVDNGSYHDLDGEVQHHLESGVLQYIIDPLGDMLANSYNGVTPRMMMTAPGDPSEDEERA